MAYDTKAQDFVFSFYLRGWSKERALPEIRKVYPGFSASTWDEWERKFDWKTRRALADLKRREFEELCRDTARALMLELNAIRQRLFQEIKENAADTQKVYAFTSVTKQIADLARQHLAQQDPQRISMEVLSRAIEKFLAGLRSIRGLEKPLEDHAAQVGKLVQEIGAEFGQEAAG